MKTLITGGTGSFGQKYTEWAMKNTDDKIVIFSRDELKQWHMKQTFKKYTDRVSYYIGDIRDLEAITDAVYGCDRIIHAAALKHVDTGEKQPYETIKTNIMGTANVVKASAGRHMVLLSTDKAVQPVNLYGATKMAAEYLTLAGGQSVVRYGNIFGSSGSILHIFQEQAAKGHLFTLTDRRMTRFIVTFQEAISLVNSAFGKGGVTLPQEVRGINIPDLALAFDKDAKFAEIGIQLGEKLHELLSDNPLTSSEDADKLSVEDIRRLINDYQSV
jgi:UDP-N-acetylglucosamine 4,6-dehydratase/5-epimerase